VLEVTSGFNVALVVNDFPDIAAELNIPFSHLGQEDFFVGGRKKMGELPTSPKVGVGLSTHSPADAKRALEAQPVYVAVGPVYATPTKPGRAAVGLDYVRWASANITQAPWFAIGGVNLANLEEVLSAGARRICVVSAILNAADIAQACQQFRQRLLSHPL
jgi:thiamine-phosphate pyrophosphorylase